MLLAGSGCGGGPTPPDNDDQNSNANDNGSSNNNDNHNANGNTNSNTNQNDNDNGQLSVEINGVPNDPLAVGAEIELTAVADNNVGAVTYDWNYPATGVITLSEDDVANPTVTALLSGQVQVAVMITDSTTGATAEASVVVVVSREPAPPPEATISATELPPVSGNNQLVTLLATLGGPSPDSVVWTPDADNPLPPEAIAFEDTSEADTMATFITSPLLNFTYTLSFTVTATYSSGGTLSDEVTITILGGG